MGFLSFSNITDQCISSYLVRFHIFSMKHSFDRYRLSSLGIKRTYCVDSMMSLCDRWDFIGKILRAPIPFFWPRKFVGSITWLPCEMLVYLNGSAWPQFSRWHSVRVIFFFAHCSIHSL